MADETPLPEESAEERKRTIRWLIVALVGAVAAGVLLASSVWDNKWKSDGNAVGNELVQNKTFDPQSLCAAQATYDAIRRELFRRAAQVRGSDDQAYTRLSDFALLRMNGPIVRGTDDQLRSVTCSGTAVLDLPPGVSAAGGRGSLSGDLDYMIQPAADGSGNVVRIGNADSIVIPLATLARTGAPQSAPLVPPELQNQTATGQPPEQQQQPAGPQGSDQAQQPATSSPSFDCDNVSSQGEVAVCSDSGLAALDRQMAADFSRAMAQGDAKQQRLLQRTRDRFISYRNRCATNQCVEETYRSRIREIGDIMTGNWRG
jgi:uncharacterized protein YecT (DUF1311 family)